LALEFEWNPRKDAANFAKHGVSFEEAATVFGDPLGRIVNDPRHSEEEERFVLLGLSSTQRLLYEESSNYATGSQSERYRRNTSGVRLQPCSAK
jgi:uncharacterized DUF497 family protein